MSHTATKWIVEETRAARLMLECQHGEHNMRNAPGTVNVPGTAGALGISVPSAAMMEDVIGKSARASEIDNGICLKEKSGRED